MAIQKSFTAKTGITSSSSYMMVSEFWVSHLIRRFSITVSVFNTSSDKDKTPIENIRIDANSTDYEAWFSPSVVDASNKNHIKQAYLYLKTLSQFQGGADV
jgi:hypothetical protein